MTADELAKLVDGLAPVIKEYVAQKVAASAAELRASLTACETGLDVRIKALESQPLPKYLGVHKDGVEYHAGAIVTRRGLWFATADTHETPGEGATAWKLIVKEGVTR